MPPNRRMESHKKGTITEEDVSVLLQRYPVTAILTVLQEISQVAGANIDWYELVKRTSSGITCPREYQRIWRYLAYNGSLEENIEVGSAPLDDDSDLEFEVEAFPPVSTEASAVAAAHVKVLMSSELSNETSVDKQGFEEALLTINIPDGQLLSEQQSMHSSHGGLNVTIPVSVQIQKPSAKMKWTYEEEKELLAAVRKHGERDWEKIVEELKHGRTISQLHKRWCKIRKNSSELVCEGNGEPQNNTSKLKPIQAKPPRQRKTSRGGSKSVGGGNGDSKGPILSEAQLAARQAISSALNMPINSFSAISSGVHSKTPNPILPPSSSKASTPAKAQTALTLSRNVAQQATSQKGVVQPQNESKPVQGKLLHLQKPPSGPLPQITKAALAAGARIVNPLTSASSCKTAQSDAATHFGHWGAFPASQSRVTKPRPPPTAVQIRGLVGSSGYVGQQSVMSRNEPPGPFNTCGGGFTGKEATAINLCRIAVDGAANGQDALSEQPKAPGGYGHQPLLQQQRNCTELGRSGA